MAGDEDAAAMRRLGERLPLRAKRQLTGDEHLAALPAGEPSPEGALLAAERGTAAAGVVEALDRELAALPAEDRLLLQLRYFDGVKLSRAAAAFGGDARQLYRRLEAVLRGLRRALENRGYDATQVVWALGLEAAGDAERALHVRPIGSDEGGRDEANLG
jgi:DNA-directed RNA polymerase specialized sigma24 family protein